jgi:hypothetical protein
VTAPDPLECLNSRAAAGRPTCNEPDSDHCESCLSCPRTCACRDTTVGLTGTQILLRSDLRQAALDGYSVVFEPSRKLTRDHHAAVNAAIAGALLRLADEREPFDPCSCGDNMPEGVSCPACTRPNETVAFLRDTARLIDPDFQRRMEEL